MSVGAHAVVGPHHGDDRNVDLRKDVDGHPQRRADPHEGDQNQHGDDRVRSLQGGFDDGHARPSNPMPQCIGRAAAMSGAESHDSR